MYTCHMTSQSFINWLQKNMKAQGIFPADVARRGKISEGALSKILNGDRRPSADTIAAIADSLGVSRAEAFFAAGYIERLGNNSPAVDELALRIEKLPPDQKKLVDALIDTILIQQEGKHTQRTRSGNE